MKKRRLTHLILMLLTVLTTLGFLTQLKTQRRNADLKSSLHENGVRATALVDALSINEDRRIAQKNRGTRWEKSQTYTATISYLPTAPEAQLPISGKQFRILTQGQSIPIVYLPSAPTVPYLLDAQDRPVIEDVAASLWVLGAATLGSVFLLFRHARTTAEKIAGEM